METWGRITIAFIDYGAIAFKNGKCIQNDYFGDMLEKAEDKKRRNFWPMSPVTRIKESKKKYNRKKDTKTLGQYLKEKSDVE